MGGKGGDNIKVLPIHIVIHAGRMEVKLNKIQVLILALIIFSFVLSLVIDKILTSKLTKLRVELEKDKEAEQLKETERSMLKKVILWSRIKFFASILLFICFILYILY